MKNLFYLILSSTLLVSCSRDTEKNNGLPDGVNIQIKVTGIEDENTFYVQESELEKRITKASLPRPIVFTDSEDLESYQIESLAEFDVLTDVQASALPSVHNIDTSSRIDSDFLNKQGAAAKTERKKAATPMQSQIQYRMLFYEAGNNLLAANQIATAGTPLQLQLDAGKTYNWYAVSINTTSVPDIGSNGVIASSNLINQDVLYTSGQITPQVGTNDLPVTFRRLTSRIEVDLNVRGLFGLVNNSTSLEVGVQTGGTFTTAIRSGDLNILTGTFSNLVNVPPVTGDRMTVTEEALGNAVKTAVFYTVRTTPIPTTSLRVRLNNLDITLDDQTTRSFTPNTLVPINATLRPTAGSLHILNVRLIEAPLLIGGAGWARTNLVYDPNPYQIDRYRFRPNNNYAIGSLENEYWVFNGETPSSAPSTMSPCVLVYPANVWRSVETTQYDNIGPVNRRNVTTVNGVRRFTAEWNLPANVTPNPAYPDNSLILIYLGVYTGGNNLTNAGQDLQNGTNAFADYWLTFTGNIVRFSVNQNNNGNLTYSDKSYLQNNIRTNRRPYRCHRS